MGQLLHEVLPLPPRTRNTWQTPPDPVLLEDEALLPKLELAVPVAPLVVSGVVPLSPVPLTPPAAELPGEAASLPVATEPALEPDDEPVEPLEPLAPVDAPPEDPALDEPPVEPDEPVVPPVAYPAELLAPVPEPEPVAAEPDEAPDEPLAA